MSTFETEALIFHALPFKERDRILTLFTPDHGLLKCFCYGNKSAFCTPLNRIEVILRQKNSDLFFCEELSITGHFLDLRQDLKALEVAGEMIRTVLDTQPFSRPSLELYHLLMHYLKALPCAFSEILAASFLLKTVHHEGLIGDLTRCNACGKPSKELFLLGGENFCMEHQKNGSLFFDEKETATLLTMLYERFLSKIKKLPMTTTLLEKIKKSYSHIILLQDSIQNW